jgi:DNA-binding MarR family transcriptional regulator
MAARMTITEGEIMEALTAALQHPEPEDDGAVTVKEMAKATGLSIATVRRAVDRLIEQGSAECYFVRRVAMDKRLQRVPGYRIRAA